MTCRPLVPVLALACLLLAGSARADGALRHEKYQLENGLTVILHEDHALPLVATNIWYHVGSREEPEGRSGFAHLFEHLMFMGTERAPGNTFDTLLEAGGGSNNASTDFDRTNYFDWGPARLLPTMLWLEADRMEGVGRAMTQEKLDLQRDVVRNERREGYDNAPYGPSELMVFELMYPKDHPYHDHVIGSHEDLAAATVDDVKAFFATYYVPNNATLVVAGDFDPAVVKPMIQGLFGALPRGKVPPRRSAPAVSLERPLRVQVADDVQLPRVTMVWHSPAFFAAGDAEMDLVASVLSDGKNSLLYKRLVHDEGLAQDVAAYQESLRLGGLFYLQVTAAPGVSLERVEAAVDEEIQRLRTEGPDARALVRAVSQIETNTVSRLQSLVAVADQLNEYDAHLGEPDRLEWDLDRHRKATADDVRTWARRVLDPDRRLVLRVVPHAETPEGLPTLDQRPVAGTSRPFDPPRPAVFALSNGVEVWHFDRPELPLVALQLLMPCGSGVEGPEQAGTASLAAAMLSEGAGERDALAFGDALEALGASFSAGASNDTTTVYLQTLRRQLEPALALFADALIRPRFDAQAWSVLKRRALTGLTQQLDDPDALARRVGDRAYFGNLAYATPTDGYPRTVEALGLDAVKAFHGTWHRPAGARVVIAGDLRADEARGLLERALGAWKSDGAPPASKPGNQLVPKGLRVFLVDRPGSAQTVVRFVLPGVPFADPARAQLGVLNALFGGNFLSRLNLNLRERHGYTYGVRSWFASYAEAGVFCASTPVQTEVTGAALAELLAELRKVATGDVTDEESATARATVEGEAVQAFQTLSGIIGAVNGALRYGLGPDALAQDVEAARRADAATLNALAKRRVTLDGGVLVLVGDRKAVLPQLEGLGLASPTILSTEDALAGRLEP